MAEGFPGLGFGGVEGFGAGVEGSRVQGLRILGFVGSVFWSLVGFRVSWVKGLGFRG